MAITQVELNNLKGDVEVGRSREKVSVRFGDQTGNMEIVVFLDLDEARNLGKRLVELSGGDW